MINKALKRLVEYVLQARGYELKEIGSPLRGFRAGLQFAKSRGLRPGTVFDIGVGYGTPWLYESFPDSKLVLIEPLSVFEPHLSDLAERLGADVHRVALAEEPGDAEINFNVGHPTSSSLLEMNARFSRFAEQVQGRHEFVRAPVHLETLDRINVYEPPYLIKLDVEGGEWKVLAGASETLKLTDFVIAEISVIQRQDGELSFAAMIAFMQDIGFELFDILSISQAAGCGQLLYLDAAFVQRGSPLWPTAKPA